MFRTVSPNTLEALRNARTRGILPRDAVFFFARNRETGAAETIGIWSEAVAATIDVIRPDNGQVVSRVYQPGAGLMSIPQIPSSLKFEERRLRFVFSRLSPAIINAVRAYDVKGQRVELHRGLLDPETRALVDPMHCRLDGFVKSVRIKRAKAGNDGRVEIEVVDHSASLRSNPIKISKQFFLDRDGDRGGDHVDKDPKIVWGQKNKVREKKKQPNVRLWRRKK